MLLLLFCVYSLLLSTWLKCITHCFWVTPHTLLSLLFWLCCSCILEYPSLYLCLSNASYAFRLILQLICFMELSLIPASVCNIFILWSTSSMATCHIHHYIMNTKHFSSPSTRLWGSWKQEEDLNHLYIHYCVQSIL